MSEGRPKLRTREGEIAQVALEIIRLLRPLEHHEKSAALACVTQLLMAQAKSEEIERQKPPQDEIFPEG